MLRRKAPLIFFIALILMVALFAPKMHVRAVAHPLSLVIVRHVPKPIDAKSEATSTLLFVGDIMLSRQIGAIMERQGDWEYPFRLIASTTRSADLAFGNLEGPISDRGILSGSIYSFRDDPHAVEGLRYAGFDVLSLANNHIWDYGGVAASDTIAYVRDAGLGAIGAGFDYDDAHRPYVRDVNGTKIAFLGYTDLIPHSVTASVSKPAVAFLDLGTATSDIALAKRKADLVVVSLHWGVEYATTSTKAQEDIAHALVDAGADLVIGHHPHVAEPLEKYKNGYIIYSLGNFIFDQNFSPDTRKGMMLRVTLRGKEITDAEEVPIAFTSDYRPYIAK